MKKYIGLVGTIAFLSIGGANAATTFTGEVGPHTVTAYSTSDVPIKHCQIKIPFSTPGAKEGDERFVTSTICFSKDIPVGKNVKICTFTHEKLIDPKLEGPIEATKCDPEPQ
jgi:hypothetical protein